MTTVNIINKRNACYLDKVDCPEELTKDNLDDFVDAVKSNVDLFDILMGDGVKADNDPGIVALCKRARKDIMMNAIPAGFRREFKNELKRAEDVQDLEQTLKNIIGETTKEEREARGRQEFDSLCRRVDRNENFSVYLKRLREEVTKVTDKVAARVIYVEDKFQKSLGIKVSPINGNVL